MGSRRKRNSSILFLHDTVSSERGAFIQFVEESGVNALLIQAMQKLYGQADKPDSPVEWLVGHFRKLAPKRQQYLDETKASLRNELMELENMILVMREEEHIKLSKIEKMCAPHCSHGTDTSFPLPDMKEYEERPQLRVDTRWRIAPHPSFKATCSQEDLMLSDPKKYEESQKPKNYLNDYGDGDMMGPEDPYYDKNQENSPGLGNIHQNKNKDTTVIFNRSNLSISSKLNVHEVESDVEDEEQDWIKNYDIYKKTSQLPVRSKKLIENSKNLLGEEELPPAADLEFPGEDEDEADEIVPPIQKILNPDSLPPNYWKPGFTINPHDEELDSSEASEDSINEEDIDEGYTIKDPENYYRPSHGPSMYIKRPIRPDIIYEHYWELWQTDLPGKNDLLNRVKFDGIDDETENGGGEGGDPDSVGKEGEEGGVGIKGYSGHENELSARENLPSVPSVHVGNSVRNWFLD